MCWVTQNLTSAWRKDVNSFPLLEEQILCLWHFLVLTTQDSSETIKFSGVLSSWMLLAKELLEINQRQGTGDNFECIFFFPMENGPETIAISHLEDRVKSKRSLLFQIQGGWQIRAVSETECKLSALELWVYSASCVFFPLGKWAFKALEYQRLGVSSSLLKSF